MKFTQIVTALKLSFTSGIHTLPLFVGYLFLIAGISLIISEWTTDRMLHQQELFFDDLIKSQQIVPNLDQITSYYLSLADRTSIFNTIGILSAIIGIVFFGIGIAIMLLTKNKIEEYYRFVGSLTFNISDNSLIVIFSTLFAISLLFVSIAEQLSTDTKRIFFQTIITSIQENKNMTTINPLLEKFLFQNSFEYALNAFHSAFFSLLSLTFVIVFLLRRTRRMIPVMLNDGMIFCCIFTFAIWAISYMVSIGITSPPQIPNLNIETPLSTKS